MDLGGWFFAVIARGSILVVLKNSSFLKLGKMQSILLFDYYCIDIIDLYAHCILFTCDSIRTSTSVSCLFIFCGGSWIEFGKCPLQFGGFGLTGMTLELADT